MAHTRGRSWGLAGLLSVVALASGLASTTTASAAQPDERAGVQQARIVGGKPTSTAEHPFVVYLTDTQGNQFCGGTIGAPNKIITAAHCVHDESPEGVRVVAGRTDKDGDDGVEAAVTGIWVHPQFTDANNGYDVAVLTLDKQLEYQPLELADGSVYQPGAMADVYGWGATAEGGQASQTLRTAQVPLVDDKSCTSSYENYDPKAMVCAGFTEGGVDSCQGDSGGPLVVDGKLAGIVSTGNGCARPNAPGIYTRVGTYADDIREQLSATANASSGNEAQDPGTENSGADVPETKPTTPAQNQGGHDLHSSVNALVSEIGLLKP